MQEGTHCKRRTEKPFQEAPECTQESRVPTRTHPAPPQMLQEVTKTLIIENVHRQVLRDNQGHVHTNTHAPRPTIHSLKPQRWKHHRLSRSHTASHRTHERNETISRLSHPPTFDLCFVYSDNLQHKKRCWPYTFAVISHAFFYINVSMVVQNSIVILSNGAVWTRNVSLFKKT